MARKPKTSAATKAAREAKPSTGLATPEVRKARGAKLTAKTDDEGWRPLRILVANDDGIHAPGLKSAEKIARALSSDVWVVAPESEQSGASHSLTLTKPLRIRKVSARKFAVDGTPTDSVSMAVLQIMKDNPPDLILSGVNRGANLADDVTYSGTIAATMQGTILGIPSIAMSQAFGADGTGKVKWATAEHYGPIVIRKLLQTGWPKGVLMNLNFPDVAKASVAGVQVTSQGKRDQQNLGVDARMDNRGNAYYWLSFSRILSDPKHGTDLRAIYDGFVSVTPLHLNFTETPTLKTLEQTFGVPAAPKKGKAPKEDIAIE